MQVFESLLEWAEADLGFISLRKGGSRGRSRLTRFEEQHGIKVSGLVFGDHRKLVDLCWLTVFGEPYISFFGKEKLLSLPGRETNWKDGRLWLQIPGPPEAEFTPENQRLIQEAKEFLNPDAFYKPEAPFEEADRPEFDVSALTTLLPGREPGPEL